MTSEFSAASLRSPPGTAGQEGLAPMPLLLIGVVFAIAIALRQLVPLNTDVSWLLVIGERMLDGQRLFRDIIEINSGTFEFSTAENEFAVIINVSSNTNFLLDVLTELDNERAEKQGLRSGGD